MAARLQSLNFSGGRLPYTGGSAARPARVAGCSRAFSATAPLVPPAFPTRLNLPNFETLRGSTAGSA
eukprot:2443846-Alexandrium_andersonii.AAC.1